MQITPTVPQPKMEPTNGAQTSDVKVEPVTLEVADHVSKAFCSAFYTHVAENRAGLLKFYGNQSMFHYEDDLVVGSAKITEYYNTRLRNTRFKITSIKGMPTFNRQGVLIQAIGTANQKPFHQMFMLGQQAEKKYYVECDQLEFLEPFLDRQEFERLVVPPSNGAANGSGGRAAPAQPEPVAARPAPAQAPAPAPAAPRVQATPKKAEEAPRQAKQETPKKEETPKKPVVQATPPQVQQPPQQVKAPAPIPQEPPKPRTWANMVGGQGRQQPPPQQQPFGQPSMLQQQMQMQQQQQHAMQQQQHNQAVMFQQAQRAQQAAHQQPSSDNLHQNDENSSNLMERKIYLGGITREIVPSNTAQAETEIKQVFYKYGEVESVHMPRKVLDSPNDTSKHAFAFITMRTKAGVQAIFAAANREDSGPWKLPLKLDAFGFDGHAQISEQRDPPSGGFRGGRGGAFGGTRGSPFFRRGPGGPGGPGGPRGGHRGGFPGGQH